MNCLHTPLLFVSLAGLAGAQDSIYVDFASGVFGFGTPSSAHAGAVPAAGNWNDIDSDIFEFSSSYVTPPLVDTQGQTTAVTLELDAMTSIFFPLEFNEPDTFGDDEALLDDAISALAPWEMRFADLAAGNYDVIVYAMAPDSSTFQTSVAVVGANQPSQTVGGDFASGYVLGATHSFHTVSVAAGQLLTIQIDVVNTNDTVSGLQVVPAGSGGGLGTNYCGPAVVNSTGAFAVMSATGSAQISSNDVTLTSSNMPLSAFGYFLTSQAQGNVPTAGTSIGTLCLGGSIGRYIGPGQIQNTGTTGSISLTIDLSLTPQPTGIVTVAAGETWSFQAWFRDTDGMGGLTSNFSDGFEITFL